MTREEAIEILEANRPDPCYQMLREAVDFAVNALKRQTCNQLATDCISRQAAIDALDCINGTEEVLRSLPSTQSNVSEKLYQYKCYITDQEGLQHEVIHAGDIRMVTGWEL